MSIGTVKKAEDSQRGEVLAINAMNSEETFKKSGLLFVVSAIEDLKTFLSVQYSF